MSQSVNPNVVWDTINGKGICDTQKQWRLAALVHKYTQLIEFITFFDLTQKNVTC
jgi:hypothetical protein